MRKPWIAIAMIALVVGLVARYRVTRPAIPTPASHPADGGSATSPEGPSAREDSRASRRPAPFAPGPPRGQSTESPLARDDDKPPFRTRADERASLASAGSMASPPEASAPPPTAPVHIESVP